MNLDKPPKQTGPAHFHDPLTQPAQDSNCAAGLFENKAQASRSAGSCRADQRIAVMLDMARPLEKEDVMYDSHHGWTKGGRPFQR